MVVPTTSLNNNSKFTFNHTIYFIFILEAVSAVMTVPSPLYNDALVPIPESSTTVHELQGNFFYIHYLTLGTSLPLLHTIHIYFCVAIIFVYFIILWSFCNCCSIIINCQAMCDAFVIALLHVCIISFGFINIEHVSILPSFSLSEADLSYTTSITSSTMISTSSINSTLSRVTPSHNVEHNKRKRKRAKMKKEEEFKKHVPSNWIKN